MAFVVKEDELSIPFDEPRRVTPRFQEHPQSVEQFLVLAVRSVMDYHREHFAKSGCAWVGLL
jgi:hypothetical protein